MSKIKEIYTCNACGSISSQWKGQCTQCGEWNSLSVTTVSSKSTSSKNRNNPISSLQRLEDAPDILEKTFSTGMEALDRVLGQGLVPGGAILIGGEPGVGKSTLLLQLAGAVAKSGHATLYLSGEESLGQIKARAERLGVLNKNLFSMSTNRIEDLLPLLDGDSCPRLLIADSIQTLGSDNADGLPGNVTQVKTVASELMEVCKKKDITLILVGHVTKDGSLAGPKLLEHMVDTVISLEGEREQFFRVMRVLKNRFGPNQELLIFHMRGNGLEVVDDPSTYFMGARDPKLSGAAIVMAMDGQRPFAVEVQALATHSYLAIPRRAVLGVDVNRLHLILAVLEKRLRLNFGQTDIYVKVGGGLRLQEPGMDLALVASILSSYYDMPVPERSVFWGEVDLNGQIRPVHGHNIRKEQAKRLAYEPAFYPVSDSEPKGIKSLSQLLEVLFGKTSKSKSK